MYLCILWYIMFLYVFMAFDGYFRLFQGTNQLENEHIGAFNLSEYKALGRPFSENQALFKV